MIFYQQKKINFFRMFYSVIYDRYFGVIKKQIRMQPITSRKISRAL